MIIFNAYVLFSLTVTLLISIMLVLRNRDRLTGMNGMIISMFLGMNIGLTSGVLFGTVYRGDLFLSTILSMLIGAAAGTITGALFSSAAAIEGLMSGIMGGMMGAMLGEMLVPEKSLILINIFLTISAASLFLFKILPKTESSIKSKKYIVKPVLIFTLFIIYLYSGSLLGDDWINDLHLIKDQEQHQHHP
ncbi:MULTISPECIES: hypothetical protein [unclassified Bacillus (in: firmicutes)]|uniref:hypothetical protein n=1 Tax=unclassified Bacillus (in: firmicutes) TaxID=185979 RepID=UPI001BE56F2E|nr:MULTISPECIES: hypothetical protein [unclassified Bacillus (in: firmicutes)]MBT2639270.1 hypothetical protein [Bacillus sp. ISL-39]MBT2659799.1 hypothetical protein [Bacillus sp. ISL-45]